jgi:hypothetical protein
MPNINSIPEVLYEPNQPYHYYYDNLPLRNILARIGLINIQVDTNADMLRGAAGSTGSVNARLDASLEADGTLKKESVDSSLHGIGHHEDGDGPDGVAYVRMTADERAKLALVQSEANRILLEIEDQFPTIGSYVTFPDGTLRIASSPSIFFEFEAPNILKAHSAFPPDVAHRHYYDRTPVSSDRRNYTTTTLATPYTEGSLRVYLNGVRLSSESVPVPDPSGASFTTTYIESTSPAQGTFRLSRTITEQDLIRIDFDQSFFATSSSSSSSGDSSSSSSSAGESSSSSSASSESGYSSSSSSSSSEQVAVSSSSSQSCQFIECGGSMAYADCGLLPTPGYLSYLDCDICECVSVPISSSSSS